MPSSTKRLTSEKYDLGSYDSNFCLKPPLLLWLVMLYLGRAVLIPFISGVSSMGAAGDTSSMTRGLFSVEDFIPAALTSVVMLAFFRRSPSASQVWRHVWDFGRLFLASAAAADLTISLYRFLDISGADMGRSQLLLLAGIIDLYILGYLFRSRRVRTVFRDFPPRA